MSDHAQIQSLLAGMAAGSEEAFTDFYRLTRPALASYVRRLLRDGRDAEEIVEDVYCYVWSNAGRFQAERGSVFTWLYMLGRSRTYDRLRKEQRRPVAIPLDGLLAHRVADPAEANGFAVLWAKTIRGLLGRLPGEQRELVELAFFEGQSHSEIAASTGLALGTVKSRIRNALLSLREELLPPGAQPLAI